MTYSLISRPPAIAPAPAELIGLLHRFEGSNSKSVDSIREQTEEIIFSISNPVGAIQIENKDVSLDQEHVKVPHLHTDGVRVTSDLLLNLVSTASPTVHISGETTLHNLEYVEGENPDSIFLCTMDTLANLPLNWFEVACGIEIDDEVAKHLVKNGISVSNPSISQIMPGYIATGNIIDFMHRSAALGVSAPARKTHIRWYSAPEDAV